MGESDIVAWAVIVLSCVFAVYFFALMSLGAGMLRSAIASTGVVLAIILAAMLCELNKE